jgi:hypothetical protein
MKERISLVGYRFLLLALFVSLISSGAYFKTNFGGCEFFTNAFGKTQLGVEFTGTEIPSTLYCY